MLYKCAEITIDALQRYFNHSHATQNGKKFETSLIHTSRMIRKITDSSCCFLSFVHCSDRLRGANRNSDLSSTDDEYPAVLEKRKMRARRRVATRVGLGTRPGRQAPVQPSSLEQQVDTSGRGWERS